ncbi:type II toxin-antitoxin system RelE/ParE family toxin [Chryseobacterium sp. Ch-15]|uniref:Type II toxin-antitoxin system RelE/ParE family toxin n=1 Tax=Chryseobacterium muglaense TaxID=2893752 RepID=A0A9Q3URG5_9FLAO|nr:type II toxin-antitoxin system RelE/ParE family toxin [Chryseobacterium muglaense]MBD3906180.1 type II toxin-antitoxin system RelE/ParE family toxin [Chryseobacterium muglaense]MCC9033799.1 type II toxin-antitoxin system RelE/ParE family toxin [Chryseobacterium muglaense]MCM2555915.1 type II toxin-antitoxin system RelE/ParE family toxin [Chryseobacterium muglaense]
MRKINISSDAKSDLIKIEEYLLDKWNERVADDFYQKLIDVIDILETTNVQFEKYSDTNFRKFLLTKHSTIIYKVEENEINIVRILQNFQNPDENYQSLND